MIRLKGDISSDSRLTIISVICKYNLIMKQEDGYVVIYTPLKLDANPRGRAVLSFNTLAIEYHRVPKTGSYL